LGEQIVEALLVVAVQLRGQNAADVVLGEPLLVLMDARLEHVAGGSVQAVLDHAELAVEHAGEGAGGLGDPVGLGFLSELFHLVEKVALIRIANGSQESRGVIEQAVDVFAAIGFDLDASLPNDLLGTLQTVLVFVRECVSVHVGGRRRRRRGRRLRLGGVIGCRLWVCNGEAEQRTQSGNFAQDRSLDLVGFARGGRDFCEGSVNNALQLLVQVLLDVILVETVAVLAHVVTNPPDIPLGGADMALVRGHDHVGQLRAQGLDLGAEVVGFARGVVLEELGSLSQLGLRLLDAAGIAEVVVGPKDLALGLLVLLRRGRWRGYGRRERSRSGSCPRGWAGEAVLCPYPGHLGQNRRLELISLVGMCDLVQVLHGPAAQLLEEFLVGIVHPPVVRLDVVAYLAEFAFGCPNRGLILGRDLIRKLSTQLGNLERQLSGFGRVVAPEQALGLVHFRLCLVRTTRAEVVVGPEDGTFCVVVVLGGWGGCGRLGRGGGLRRVVGAILLADPVDFGEDGSLELVCLARVRNLLQILNGNFEEFLDRVFGRLVETTAVGIDEIAGLAELALCRLHLTSILRFDHFVQASPDAGNLLEERSRVRWVEIGETLLGLN